MPLFAPVDSSVSFRLDDAFLASYRYRKPPFGFGVLGELVFLRTYSRLKADGTNEAWWETVARVVNGTYSMQKRWVMAMGLGWNEDQARASAEEMYDRIYTMKFLPPGRGLWAMGSPLTEERGLYAALNNCFSGNTEFLTKHGLVRFVDVVGREVEVLNRDGEFVPARVRSYGRQPVQRITFRPAGLRTNHQLSVTATPNHTWVLHDGTRTTALKVGDAIQSNTACVDQEHPDYAAGLRHGVIFGDGTQHTYYPDRFMIRLCGAKAQALRGVLEEHERHVSTTAVDADPYVTVRSEVNLKALPRRGSHHYIAGFIRGWAAADSYTKPSGTLSIDTQNAEAAAWLVRHAPFAGYVVTGHGVDARPTNFGPRSAPLNRMSVTEAPMTFRVTAIEALEPEEVFCVTEPLTGTFTLAAGLLTGNCAFVSTETIAKDKHEPFTFLMEASMLGIGVGFDTRGAGRLAVLVPDPVHTITWKVPDTREGWVESLKHLLHSYLLPQQSKIFFDYSLIRPAGAPIKGFGGVAAGPEPLRRMHEAIRGVLDAHAGRALSGRGIVDIMNMIGACVVAGNVRRTAEIAFGAATDEEFLNLKNYRVNPERQEYGWTSNNSVFATLGTDYGPIAERIADNGEPGLAWLDNMRAFGRLADLPNNKDRRAMGGNPCLEQTLESYELCCLVETFPARHDSLEDYQRTLKYAYLYSKTVTLGKTPWEKTNRVLLRNRRIGCSMSGIVQAIDKLGGLEPFREWCDRGYRTIQHWDEIYSEWLTIPRSIKTTSVKPSGTVSLLAGATPGMHYPENRHYIRRIRISRHSELLPALAAAGYPIEPCVGQEETTVVVEIPVSLGENLRTVDEVSIWEQFALAAFMQRWWADNQVSCTVTFKPGLTAEEAAWMRRQIEVSIAVVTGKPVPGADVDEFLSDAASDRQLTLALKQARSEVDQIAPCLNHYQYQLKGISLLPRTEAGAYAQMPYERISAEEYTARQAALQPLQLSATHEEAEQERYCDGASCVLA